MAKVSVDQTMDDIVHIQNQINGLQLLLNEKKSTMAKYFDKTGERTVSSDECTVYVQERTSIEYDIDALREILPKEQFSSFVESTYTVYDWKAFCRFLKDNGISPKELRPYISITREVNQNKLSELYKRGVIKLTQLKGCYTATVKKSVVLKMKNIEREIPIQEKA